MQDITVSKTVHEIGPMAHTNRHRYTDRQEAQLPQRTSDAAITKRCFCTTVINHSHRRATFLLLLISRVMSSFKFQIDVLNVFTLGKSCRIFAWSLSGKSSAVYQWILRRFDTIPAYDQQTDGRRQWQLQRSVIAVPQYSNGTKGAYYCTVAILSRRAGRPTVWVRRIKANRVIMRLETTGVSARLVMTSDTYRVARILSLSRLTFNPSVALRTKWPVCHGGLYGSMTHVHYVTWSLTNAS